jgi:hypothetical protein
VGDLIPLSPDGTVGAYLAPLPTVLTARQTSGVQAVPLEVRRARLAEMVTQIGKKWGQGAIVRIGDLRRAQAAPAPTRLQEEPPWWPSPDRGRPRLLELIAPTGAGALTVALTWLGAAKPLLAAVVDPLCALYPPAAASAGVDLRALLLVRPPAATSRLVVDTLVLLLRSESLDAIVCQVPERARASVAQANYTSRRSRHGPTRVWCSSPGPTRCAARASSARLRTTACAWSRGAGSGSTASSPAPG